MRTIEEKAKAYDKLFVKASRIYNKENDVLIIHTIEDLFPELKKSEDELHRKWILEYLYDGLRKSDEQFKDQFKCAIEWFEKQGEQKPANWLQELEDKLANATPQQIAEWKEKYFKEEPAEWSEEDEENLKWFEKFFRAESVISEGKDIPQDKYLWFKNLKGRVQPKQEWSEEDERKMRAIITIINSTSQSIICSIDQDRESLGNWLKSLRPQSQWKPSLAQMNALSIVSKGNAPDDIEAIMSLYQDLKQLKGG